MAGPVSCRGGLLLLEELMMIELPTQHVSRVFILPIELPPKFRLPRVT